MSFFNNPENNSIKVIILVVLVAIAGYFVYKNMQSSSLGGQGRVINMTNTVPSSGTADRALVGGVTVIKDSPTPEKAYCHPGDYPTAAGGCVSIDSNCNASNWRSTPCGTSAVNKVVVDGQTILENQPAPAKAYCHPGDYPTAAGGCVSIDSSCNASNWRSTPCGTSATKGTSSGTKY